MAVDAKRWKDKRTLEKGLQAGEDELKIRVRADSEAEEQDARDHRGEGNGALPADVLDVDCVVSNCTPRNADNRRDSVIPVDDTVRRLGYCLAAILKILRKESVEQWIAHANRRPTEPY